jgi:hypothetical protein
MSQEIRDRIVDSAHDSASENLRILVRVERIMKERVPHLLRDRVGEAALEFVANLIDAR